MHNKLKLAFLISIGYVIITQSCDVGHFINLTNRATGSTPFGMAYSPFAGGNVYIAVVGSGDNTVTIYSEDPTTGLVTPIATTGLSGTMPFGVAFSSVFNGNLFFAVVNNSSANVSVYQVNIATGAIHEVPGSPFSLVPLSPDAIAYSPIIDGNLFAAVINASPFNVLSIFPIDPVTGAFNTLAVSAIGTDIDPSDVAFSPIIGGKLFAAVANFTSNTVSVYNINPATGAPTFIGNFNTLGSGATGVAFSPLVSGNLFAAVTNFISNNISVYSVDTSTGVFTQIGSPVLTGISPTAIAFSPLIGGNFFAAVSNFNNGNISIYSVDTMTGVFTLIQTVTTGAELSDIKFSPILPGGLFAAAIASNVNTLFSYQVEILVPIITTPSIAIRCSRPITINATIDGGTPPFTVVWADGFTQTVDSNTLSRIVNPQGTTSYQIASITDSNGCTAGPSNQITITIIGNNCCSS